MRQVSLCFLIKRDRLKQKVLLAMKKRGFGQGKWNGVGGKIDREKGDKNVLDSAIRETEEEIKVKAQNFKKVAIIDFYFPEIPQEKGYDQQVHVFLVEDWDGEPAETEEMSPKWFNSKELPFDETWDDDKYWLPSVLNGKKLRAKFSFNKENKVVKKNIEFVDEFQSENIDD